MYDLVHKAVQTRGSVAVLYAVICACQCIGQDAMLGGHTSMTLRLLLVAGKEHHQPSPTSQCRSVSKGEVSKVSQLSTQKPSQASTGQNLSSMSVLLAVYISAIAIASGYLVFLHELSVQDDACVNASMNSSRLQHGPIQFC